MSDDGSSRKKMTALGTAAPLAASGFAAAYGVAQLEQLATELRSDLSSTAENQKGAIVEAGERALEQIRAELESSRLALVNEQDEAGQRLANLVEDAAARIERSRNQAIAALDVGLDGAVDRLDVAFRDRLEQTAEEVRRLAEDVDVRLARLQSRLDDAADAEARLGAAMEAMTRTANHSVGVSRELDRYARHEASSFPTRDTLADDDDDPFGLS